MKQLFAYHKEQITATQTKLHNEEKGCFYHIKEDLKKKRFNLHLTTKKERHLLSASDLVTILQTVQHLGKEINTCILKGYQYILC